MYGWDSYFEALGLLIDGRIELARGMLDNFCYEIEHYGKILNANRSYYLTRSQPPFLTDMILEVSRSIRSKLQTQIMSPHIILPSYAITNEQSLKIWMAQCLRASIKELFSVWLSEPRYNPETGLSTFHAEGLGMPIETESTHFNHILIPYAQKHGIELEEFKEKYLNDEIHEPELDEYFVHDRTVRESGHDTTYRFEGRCANLATIDLNCLVFKYENDIADMIEKEFNGAFPVRIKKGPNDENLNAFMELVKHLEEECSDVSTSNPIEKLVGNNGAWNSKWGCGIIVSDDVIDASLHGPVPPTTDTFIPNFSAEPELDTFTVTFTPALFRALANRMKTLVQQYLWNDEKDMYYDYDLKEKEQSVYDSVTCLWALWAGLCPKENADRLVKKAFTLFEVTGGLVCGTEESRGRIGIDRPNRQWVISGFFKC
jgi:alpha,alpha-trehalase